MPVCTPEPRPIELRTPREKPPDGECHEPLNTVDEACGPVELAGDRPQQGKAKQRARSGGPVCPQPGAQLPQLVADHFAHQSQGQHRGPEQRGQHPRCESVCWSGCSEWKGTAPRRGQHLTCRPRVVNRREQKQDERLQ